MEGRIAERAEEEGGEYWDVAAPAALVVQEETRAMFENIIELLVVLLTSPRAVFEEPTELDTFMRPQEGWPAALRRIATSVSTYLNDAANDYEELEASSIPAPPEVASAPRRVKLFARSQEEPEAE